MELIAAAYLSVALMVPTEMIVSNRPDNRILMIRNYDDFDRCRDDRLFVIELAARLKQPIWVTCTPMGMK